VIESACEGLATALERAQGLPAHRGRSRPGEPNHAVRRQRDDPRRSEFLEPALRRSVRDREPLAAIAYDPALFAGQDVMKVAPLLTVGIGLALRRLGDKK
jgi:hypothetical protein